MSNESDVSATWREIFQTQSDQRNFPVIVADGHTLFVNKFTFAGCSPVFQTALFGNFKEANDGEFNFPTKSVGDIVELFACLFWIDECPQKEVELGNFSLLWDMADEYLIEVSGLLHISNSYIKKHHLLKN